MRFGEFSWLELAVIVRTWHGRTRIEDAEAYESFIRARAAPDYASVAGLVRAVFTRRDDVEVAHFLFVTFWEDMASVEAFAGPDPARAKYYPKDELLLLEMEEHSLNHQVFFDSWTSGNGLPPADAQPVEPGCRVDENTPLGP